MNLTLVSTGQFPDFHASSIRQSTLAKGLVEQGHSVTFLVLIPQNWEGGKKIKYFGVQFQELNSYNGKNKILKYYHFIGAIINASRIIKQQATQKKIDALFIFSFWTIHLFPIYLLVKRARVLNIKVFHEITELPYVFGYKKYWLNFYENNLLPKFDGIFIISNKLKSYVQQFNNATKIILTVVDAEFFSTTKVSPYPFPYICYCGTSPGNKDGVPILMEAFAKITQHYPNLKLVMVGKNTDKEAIKETTEAVIKFGLEDKVIFTGQIDRELMPAILCNAQILVLSKPDNEQNSGNFPIKIGEYLATGVPVVVTAVGEIPLFIKDGESGFLAEPGNPESFASKMDEAISNPVRAKTIGETGKKVSQKMFDYKIQVTIMADYIAGKII